MSGKKLGQPKNYSQSGNQDLKRGDNTLEFNLLDPKIDLVANLADKEPSRLKKYRRFFSNYSLMHSNDNAGLNFERFIANIRAAGFIRLETQDVDVFFTRSAAFLVFTEVPDFGLLKSMSSEIDFVGRTSIAESTSDNHRIILIRLTGSELNKIIKKSEKIMSAKLINHNIQKLREMLSECAVYHSDGDFNIRNFSERIEICDIFEGEGESNLYFVTLKDDDSIYVIYPEDSKADSALCCFEHAGTKYSIEHQYEIPE